MAWKYKDTMRPYRSGEYYYRPKPHPKRGLGYKMRMKKLMRQRIAINKKEALRRLRDKYFRYTPRIPSYGRGSFFGAKRKR